jgi:hypothetical protein
MRACLNIIPDMLVVRVSGYLRVMRSIIIPKDQAHGRVLIMIAVAEPLRLSGNQDKRFADF